MKLYIKKGKKNTNKKITKYIKTKQKKIKKYSF